MHVFMGNGTLVEGHQLRYNDCSSPTDIIRLDALEACNQKQRQLDMTKYQNYILLQRVGELETGGWHCYMEVSDFLLFCGAFSHMKLLKTPTVDKPTQVSQAQCREWVTSERFVPPGTSETRVLTLPGTTVISVNSLGVVHPEGQVSCQGQDLKIGGNILEDILELTQYKITLTQETFEIRNNRVEAVAAHSVLPPDCIVENRGCITNEGTYVWDPILNHCKLRNVREVILMEEGPMLVDHTNKLTFEMDGEIVTPYGCPAEEKIFATKWRNLYLTKGQGFARLSPADVDIALYSATRADYLEWTVEDKVNILTQDFAGQLCETRYGSTTNKILRLKGAEDFGMRSGDAFLTFKCPEKTSTIAVPDGNCYDAVKLENGLFVDLVMRVARRHASKMDCSTHFPMYIQTLAGSWVTISDEVRAVDPPQHKEILNGYPEHESFTVAGLYTQEELDSWEMLATWGDYHEAVTNHLSQGICRSEENGPCPRAAGIVAGTRYDLTKLLVAVGLASPWERFNSWVQANVGILCVVVLIVYGIQWSIAIGMAVYSFATDGPGTAFGGLYATFCPTPHMYSRLRRANKRRREREKEACIDMGEELKSMNPQRDETTQ